MKAVLWMALAIMCFAVVTIAVREAGRTVSSIHMLFYRSLFSCLILLIGLKIAGITLASLWTRRPGLQLARTFAHFFAQWSWMHALLLIPMLELLALEFTIPLWVAVLAPFMIGERLTSMRIAAAVVGFVGALVIIRPGSATLNLGTVLALTCAVLFALNIIGTKYLTRFDGPLTILLVMAVNHTILAFLLGFRTLQLPGAYALMWLVMMGAASLLAHFAMVRAFQHADAIVVAPMDFMRLPIIAGIGFLFYQEHLHAAVLLGTALVIAGNVLNMRSEREGKPRST